MKRALASTMPLCYSFPMYAGSMVRGPLARLKKRSDFMQVYTRGLVSGGRYFSLHILRTGKAGRIGIVVPRRFGNAVARNRVKRLVREGYRRNRLSFSGMDIVVIPRPMCKGQGLATIERALREEVSAALSQEVSDGKGSNLSDEERI